MEKHQDELIKKIDEINHMPCAQQKLLKSMLKHRRLLKDEYFIRANEAPQSFAYINEGVFRVYCVSRDGIDKTLSFRTKGQFIAPYTPLLYKQSVWYFIQAISDCEISYISVLDYKNLSSSSTYWERIEKSYIIDLFKEKEERERSFLMDDASARYNNFIKKYPQLAKKLNQKYIASYLGITPVSLSRLKTQNRS